MRPFFDSTPATPKICGITSLHDALGAIEAGAGALGFNFYPPSPRSIAVDSDFGWIRDLAASFPDVARVAVVVNPDEKLLQQLGGARCFDSIQFHGEESPEFCAREGKAFCHWIKALRVRSEEDLQMAAAFQTPFLLLDGAVPGGYGGGGQTMDWSLAARFVEGHPERRVILAGGLTPENVAAAVRHVHPHAVDVASGVESSPGCKEMKMVQKFIVAALTC